jgi:hypothetical protein
MAIRSARASAPGVCETTALPLHSDRSRYGAAPLCRTDPADCGGLPHFRPILAAFHPRSQGTRRIEQDGCGDFVAGVVQEYINTPKDSCAIPVDYRMLWCR